VSTGGDFKAARNGAGCLGLIWLIGLFIFVGPFTAARNAFGIGVGVILGIAWTAATIWFWNRVGSSAAREEARWEWLQRMRFGKKASKEGGK
jgi:hypothetical protein